MTPKQQELLRVRYEMRVLARLQDDLVEEIAVDCDHPIRRPYQWEWDDGYGHQKMITGDRCTLCGAKRPWAAHSPWRRP